MLVRILLLPLLYLASFESGILAVTVIINTTDPGSVPAATPFPIPNLDTTASDPSSKSCDDIHSCRTLISIIQSCMLTIFACICVAIHRNIPGPKQSWISIQLEWLKVVALTLLIPEWVLAWAVRQSFDARATATMLEHARVFAQNNWKEKHNKSTVVVQVDDRSTKNEVEDKEYESLADTTCESALTRIQCIMFTQI